MISLSYVNKGKADVSNVEAELDGEVDSAAKVQYLGNFEPGKSGSIGFVFTPQTAGKTDITLKIQYEDAGQEIHTLTFPLSLDVQDSPVMEGDDMDYLAEEPKSGPGGVAFCGGWGGAAGRRHCLPSASQTKGTEGTAESGGNMGGMGPSPEPGVSGNGAPG